MAPSIIAHLQGKRARAQQSPAPGLADAQGALDACIGATSLIEVTLNSLDSQAIAAPEQEVLKRALQSVWTVYDWIDDLGPDDLDGAGLVAGKGAPAS